MAPPPPEILVYTQSTMNGWKPVIMLEELGVEYEVREVSFDKREQKSEWYLKLNPNGRIPTIVDRGNEDFVVFESGAILWYLAEKYGKFLSTDANERSATLQWLFFQVGGIGPMMGQAMYFQRIAAPQGHQDDFAIRRFVDESRRLLEVVDARLDGRDYLVGDDISIADFATYPWARAYSWAKVSVDGLPNLQAWFDRIDARPATKRALAKPHPFPAFFGQGDVEAAVAKNSDRFKTDVKTTTTTTTTTTLIR
ncbi:hypothetical protein CTAYLR_002897 [Chrysophaeum taylorii]|uniref:Glutathione S-transferase n=1 Tax=Chrysophaeum taylorii TaxID=2483200 RepID=A0AAD7UNP4_9STRA|nr:hypothetical protein CTAYLR_002897 [Chrysophaeum taylorii]